jgi:hypothetical protein
VEDKAFGRAKRYLTVTHIFCVLLAKKAVRSRNVSYRISSSNTYINSGAEEIGELRHTTHDGAPYLTKPFTIIAILLFLPNCVQNWLRLFIKCNRLAIYSCSRYYVVKQNITSSKNFF